MSKLKKHAVEWRGKGRFQKGERRFSNIYSQSKKLVVYQGSAVVKVEFTTHVQPPFRNASRRRRPATAVAICRLFEKRNNS